MVHLNGRVFTRLQQYDALPTELKDEVERLEQYLVTIQSEVFGSHRTLKLKSIYGVRRRELLVKIEAWVKQHGRKSHPSAAVAATAAATGHHGSTSQHVNQHVDPRLNQHHHEHQQHGSLTDKVQEKIHDKTHETHPSASTHPSDVTHRSDLTHASHPSGSTHTTHASDLNQHHDHQQHGSLTSKVHDKIHDKTHETHPSHSTHPSDVTHRTHPSDLTHPTHPSGSTHTTHPSASAHPTQPSDLTHQTHPSHSSHPTATPTPTPIASNVGNFQIAGSATPATAPQTPLTHTTTTGGLGHATSPHATQLLDALVLKGFVTPQKEEKPDDAPSVTTDDLELKANEFLIARDNNVAVSKTGTVPTTVWDLVDGAVFAGMLKRKAGLLEPLTHGKDTYAIVNRRLKNLTLFKSDLGRKPVAQMDASKLKVAFDKTHYEHGVKVWTGTDTELLNAPSASESDALVEALLAVGATHDQQPHHGHAMTGATTTGEKLRHDAKKAVGSDTHTDTKHHNHHGLTGDKHHSLTGDKHHTMTGDKHHTPMTDKHHILPGDKDHTMPGDKHHGLTGDKHHTMTGEKHGLHGRHDHTNIAAQHGLNTHNEKYGGLTHGEHGGLTHGEHSGLTHGQGQEQMMPNQHQSGGIQTSNPLTHGHGHTQEQMMPNQYQHQSGHVQSGNPLTHDEYPSHTTQQQQSQQQPMKTEAQQAFESEDHAKRSDAPRGFSQVQEPTMTP